MASIYGPNALNPASGKTTADVYTFNDGYTGVIQANAYVKPDDQQVAWLGAKYALLSNLDAAVGYYYEWQNDYTAVNANKTKYTADQGYVGTACGPSTITGTSNSGYSKTHVADANHSSCAGHQEAISGMLDWRPVKRVDIYGGVMYSDVTGGFANASNSKGYAFDHLNNTAFTTGVRVAF